MNDERRKKIKVIITKINSCVDDLTLVKDDEDEARENTPENLQSADAYSISQEYSDKMDDIITDLQEAVTALQDLI